MRNPDMSFIPPAITIPLIFGNRIGDIHLRFTVGFALGFAKYAHKFETLVRILSAIVVFGDVVLRSAEALEGLGLGLGLDSRLSKAPVVQSLKGKLKI